MVSLHFRLANQIAYVILSSNVETLPDYLNWLGADYQHSVRLSSYVIGQFS